MARRDEKHDMDDSFVSESSSSLFQMVPSSNVSNPKIVESEFLNSVLQSSGLSKRRRSWPPGSPKEHSNSDNHGIFVTCDDETDEFGEDNAKGFSNKGFYHNSFHHNDIFATRSLAPKVSSSRIRSIQRANRLRQNARRSRKRINNNVEERMSLFKALVHADGENSSNGIGSEASRGLNESIGGDSNTDGGSNYRQFDDLLMEGHSGGSIRALAVEAAFVANGILRRSAQQGKTFFKCIRIPHKNPAIKLFTSK